MHALDSRSRKRRERFRLAGRALLLAIVGIALLALVGCGGKSEGGDPVLAWVGNVAIHRSAVERRAHAIERQAGGSVSDEDARRRALNALIVSYWTLEEAKARHLVSLGPAGVGAGLESEVKVAARALHEALERSPIALAQSEVEQYYRSHLAHLEQFYSPESRVTDLVENLPSRAVADALRLRLGVGARFKSKAVRELVKRPPSFGEGLRMDNGLLERIFSAKLGVIAAPVEYNHGWVLSIVRKILPGHTRPLAPVRPEVVRLMTLARREAAAKRFVGEFKRRWTARTICTTQLVVSACARYDRHGQSGEEGPEIPF